IWQTVWMGAVDQYALQCIHVITAIDQQQEIIHLMYYQESTNTLNIRIKKGGNVISTPSVANNNTSIVAIPIENPKLWSPESPFLYDLELFVTSTDGRELDRVSSYFGMRKIHVEGNKIYLNNEPYYQRLVLDQGFYPTGIWTSPSDD